MLSGNPADQRTLSEWADFVGMTSRTLARHIQKATNLTFGQWRQQIRLLEGLKKLGRKESVTKVAMDLGYDSPSAFIAMFKKALGGHAWPIFQGYCQNRLFLTSNHDCC
jgi:AraC-like DNA-binding protein